MVSEEQKVKNMIVDVVTERQGLKVTELVAHLPWSGKVREDAAEFIVAAVQELVDEGNLIEIEYTLPDMEYRTKGFLLPKGALIMNLDRLTA